MKGKVFLRQSLILAMILLGHIQGYKSCIVKEREALLELKTYIVSHSRFQNALPTWSKDTESDCCGWEGIKCNRTTGRVIKLSIQPRNLWFKERFLLNLSLLHPFEDVRSLHLSGSGLCKFTGLFDDVEGYKSLGRLRNLEILDLSSNEFNNSIFPFLNAATSLTTLFLRNNKLDDPFLVEKFKDLKNLELLDLSGNKYNSSISIRELSTMRKLKALDLSGNGFTESVELQELKNLTNLEVLGLARNSFSGPIPIEVFCEMKNIQELDLGENHFVGQIPQCLGSLSKLRVLDLSLNQISGNLPSSFSSLESLEYLSLSDNNFTGVVLLNPLTNLTKLKVFKLSSTSNMIQVEAESTWHPKFQLSAAQLSFCNMEKIPNFLIYQKNLRLVDLSNNRLSGHFPTWLLKNNPKLEVLLLKNNSFTFFHMPSLAHKLQVMDFSANDIDGVFPDNIGHALPNLVHLNGSHNSFQGNLPSSLGEMKNISFLDLSYNNFTGELHKSFVMGCFSLRVLKLSHNSFGGHFLTRRTNLTSLRVLRIDNNLITGKIGVGLRSSFKLSLLDMSNNRLTGVIPIWISNFSHLDFLTISNNFLEGAVPPSLLLNGNFSCLDLSGNLLSGVLPSHVRKLDYNQKMLFLHNNYFTGPIPRTLLENVMVLDLRDNKLSGGIPKFVNAQEVRFLLLRGNDLTGSIPRQLCDLSNIRFLDLSDNKLNGSIPSCLNNLSFGLGRDKEMMSYYPQSAGAFILEFYKSTFVSAKFGLVYFNVMEIEIRCSTKQRYESYTGASDELSRGTLNLLYGLDLSNNELSGVIPTEFGDLSKLKTLNLSRNYLSSSIPDSFSKLKDIESLDLSFNMLHGSIPQQLNNLTSLSSFDVSYNNLSGVIPQGRQFDTFNEKSYLGNPLLCGHQKNISCEAKKNSEEVDNEEEEDEDEDESVIDMLVFYWSIVSTYVIFLIGSIVLMSFDCPWRRAWLCFVDAFILSAKSLSS